MCNFFYYICYSLKNFPVGISKQKLLWDLFCIKILRFTSASKNLKRILTYTCLLWKKNSMKSPSKKRIKPSLHLENSCLKRAFNIKRLCGFNGHFHFPNNDT